MLTSEAFEELLATYPADKRELARRVYQRFAEGDSTEFFTQLFLVLDIYAHYAERVPQAVIEANQSAQAQFTRLRDEIGLLAQAIDKRNLNISNQAEQVEELCYTTQARTGEIVTRFDSLLKSIGTQIDTRAIIAGIRQEIESGLKRDIITPFVTKTNELAKEVTPALKELRDTADQARTLWPKHIWQTVWFSSAIVIMVVTALITFAIHMRFESRFAKTLAPKIAAAERSLEQNREAFRELALAGTTIKVMRPSHAAGVTNPGGFAVAVENADNAETRTIDGRKYGLIFFTCTNTEVQIHDIREQIEQLWKSVER